MTDEAAELRAKQKAARLAIQKAALSQKATQIAGHISGMLGYLTTDLTGNVVTIQDPYVTDGDPSPRFLITVQPITKEETETPLPELDAARMD